MVASAYPIANRQRTNTRRNPIMGSRPSDTREDDPYDVNEAVPTYNPNSATGAGDAANVLRREQSVNPTAQTRTVQPDELVETRLNRLMSGNSDYIRRAEQRGAETAAARGSLAGSYYAGAARGAAQDAALQIASPDAATYGRTAAENMAAQNAAELNRAQNTLSLELDASQGQRERDRIMAEREQSALGRNLTREQARADRRFQQSENREDRAFSADQARLSRRAQAAAAAMDTMLSDPSYWRDPEGLAGFIQNWETNVLPIFDDVFGEGP